MRSKTVFISNPAITPLRKESDFRFIQHNIISPLIDALKKVGFGNGITWNIPQLTTRTLIAPKITQYAALVILGGPDITPSIYHKPNHSVKSQPQVDAYEIALIREAIAHNIPILGVCRGMQLINVALGGTLYEDIDEGLVQHHSFSPTTPYADSFVVHDIQTSKRSFIDSDKYVVASAHHQAIEKLGKGLEVFATNPTDKIIEGVATSNNRVVGTQWHPEASFIPQSPLLLPLLENLAQKAFSNVAEPNLLLSTELKEDRNYTI